MFYLFAALVGGGLLYIFLATRIARKKLRTQAVAAANKNTAPVSILKPLKGSDDNLEENLRSFFNLDYPKYELLFAVRDADDPAVPVVKELISANRHISARLVIGGLFDGLNPKITNLQNMLPYAEYDFLLISDSNVRVRPDYLHAQMGEMDDNTGLVTATIRGVAADSFGSILENLHLNTYIASSVFAVSHLFRMPVSIGKSMLLRRSFIEKIGGFRKFADYLAEDHLLSEEVLKHGMQVAHSTHMIDNVNNSLSIGQFCSRHLRWARMRRNLSIGNFAAEMISNPVFNALVYLAIAQDTPATILFLIALEAKLTLDALMLKAMDSDLPVSTLLLSPVRDIIIGIIWFVPFMGNKINWRGNRFRIHRGTLLSRA